MSRFLVRVNAVLVSDISGIWDMFCLAGMNIILDSLLEFVPAPMQATDRDYSK